MTPFNLIHYAKCFFALEYFSKDSLSLLLKAKIVTFTCLSYYVTCHMKIYQSKIHNFSFFWVSYLFFRLSYPLCLICLGITPVFSLPYPYCLTFLGITPVFSLSYPHRITSLGIMLVFPLSYPHRLIPLGIALAFSPPIPILSHFSGYHTCFFPLSYPHRLIPLGITLAFSPPIPTTSILSKIA